MQPVTTPGSTARSPSSTPYRVRFPARSLSSTGELLRVVVVGSYGPRTIDARRRFPRKPATARLRSPAVGTDHRLRAPVGSPLAGFPWPETAPRFLRKTSYALLLGSAFQPYFFEKPSADPGLGLVDGDNSCLPDSPAAGGCDGRCRLKRRRCRCALAAANPARPSRAGTCAGRSVPGRSCGNGPWPA